MSKPPSRRSFLGSVAGVAALASPFPKSAGAAVPATGASARITALLETLPGTKAASIFAGDGSFEYARNPTTRLVIASTFKVFVAVAALQLVDQGKAALDEMLPVDASVWVPGSTAFTPALRGKVPLRVAIQEMIAYSDNTATDMVMKRVGAQRIRAMIANAGLKSVQIPDSIRAFFSYLAGLPRGVNASYEQLYGLKPPPKNLHPRPPANDVVTVKGAMGEIAGFYKRALAGEFFQKAETLIEFQAAMNQGKLIELSAPLGSQIFTKAGSFENDGHNGVVVAGSAQTLDKHLYYAIGVNWHDASAGGYAKGETAFFKVTREILAIARSQQFSAR
jgi:beta-lactamase class A